ncbi:C-type lectin domain family 17, member A-like isoform X2 [Polyodon spathula]|uniref:C-type lectin domain family 17, member A-like isoform X2 n=1 Tax=Polyodon spathula TaxID=7913 RepID=UPI001B7DF304|nr:C-type lectin domain family 17, member A-like isoform X2 [Polyodon spathula]
MAGIIVSENFYSNSTTDQREPEGKDSDSDYDDVGDIVCKNQEKSKAFKTNIELLDDSDYEEVDDIVEIHEQLNTEDKNDCKIHDPPVKSACGTRAIVLLYILLIISFVMWGVLLYMAIVKYSEISSEVQNLTTELSMMRENDISSQIRSMKTDISQMKTEVAVSKSYIWEQFLKKYTFSTEKKKWAEARDICVSQGASLAVVKSIAELAYLKERIEEPHWIGLRDLETEGEWKWLDGTEVDKSYWKSDQPDNFSEEDCGEILQIGELNDSHCNTMRHWICQK